MDSGSHVVEHDDDEDTDKAASKQETSELKECDKVFGADCS